MENNFITTYEDLYEKLYKTRQKYNETAYQLLLNENRKKQIFSNLYFELKNIYKSQKEAELKTYSTKEYIDYMNALATLEKEKSDLFNEIDFLKNKMESIKMQNINKAVELKHSNGRGD